jgi:hypothetical protein
VNSTTIVVQRHASVLSRQQTFESYGKLSQTFRTAKEENLFTNACLRFLLFESELGICKEESSPPRFTGCSGFNRAGPR